MLTGRYVLAKRTVFSFTISLQENQSQIIVTSGIGVPAYLHNELADKDQMARIPAPALIDTGASRSCISRRLAVASKIKPVSMAKMSTAGGIVSANIYVIDLFLPNNLLFPGVQVSEFSDGQNFDIIIGMDIIRSSDIAITNARGKTVFSMRIPPDYRHIDYNLASGKDKAAKLAAEYIHKNQTGAYL